MRTLLLCLLIFIIPCTVASQHFHFIYIQGDNQQAFYLKKSGDLHSSSATGFLILPKLQSGTHQFTIGFPRAQWPEYEFQVEIKSADRGFTLKNFDDKGWGLFDLQSMEIIYGKKIDPPKSSSPPQFSKTTDPFSVILASAVGDEGIRETGLLTMAVAKTPAPVAKAPAPVSPPVSKTEPPATKPNTNQDTKKQTTKPEVKADSQKTPVPPPITKNEEKPDSNKQVAANTDPKPDEKKAAPAFESAPVIAQIPGQGEKTTTLRNTYALSSRIRKISDIRLKKTSELIFVDVTPSGSDTINIIIDDDLVEEKTAEPGKKEEEKPAALPKANRTNCTNMATEKEMLALRKRVLKLSTEEEMMEQTMRDIKARCYTVDMLQNLSYVFVSDKMRYRLFEQAYPYIYDPSNYAKLERILGSEEYINQFRDFIKSK